MKSIKGILALIAVLLAANLIATLSRPADPFPVGLAMPAKAGGLFATDGAARRVYTTSEDGRTLHVWEDDRRGWKCRTFSSAT